MEAPGEQDTLVFAQLSDPHLTSLTGVGVGELLSKRLLGYLSWRKHRRAEHRPHVLEALLRDLHELGPDHVVVTGDLTHIGLPREFHEASVWLGRLGSPGNVTVIPGNHDSYVDCPWPDTYAHWAPYMISDTAGDEAVSESASLRSVFPSIRVRGPVAFIGVSTARPSAPLFAVGSIGAPQLERLEAALAAHRDLFRVLLIHHPPLPHTVSWRRRLTDGPALRDVLQRTGVELILHGHTHRTRRDVLTIPDGPVPVIGVASASAVGRRPGRGAQYHVFQVSRSRGGWRMGMGVRTYRADSDCFNADGAD